MPKTPEEKLLQAIFQNTGASSITFVNEKTGEKREYKDPECPKCGLKLGNKMYYVCPKSHCPSGLN